MITDWAVDFALPQSEDEYYTRSESMVEATFTTDYNGAPLGNPVTLLILGAFEHLDTWETDGTPAEDSCRGLALLPHPAVPGARSPFGGLEDPGHIVCSENLEVSPTRVLELDIVDYFNAYRGGDWSGVRIGPYNEFTLAAAPATLEPLHLIGLYVRAADTDLASYFLARRLDGSYGSVKIPSPDGKALRGTRTIVPSPWPEDQGRVFYFGGFDAHGGPHTATAWIIKGTLPEP